MFLGVIQFGKNGNENVFIYLKAMKNLKALN